MKFKKTWASVKQALPPELQRSVIDYRAWKKKINGVLRQEPSSHHRPLLTILQDLLETDIKRSNRTFVNLLQRPLGFWRYNNHTTYSYAKLNKECVYKLLKKLDKKLHLGLQGSQWQQAIYEMYDICGQGKLYKQLEIKCQLQKNKQVECPVCLESNRKECVILGCGHVLCTSCLKHMYKVSELHGTLTNLLCYSEYHHLSPSHNQKCPLCRCTIVARDICPCKIDV